MLVVEGTYENGELHLDSPVSYPQPVRVRVEFLEELSAAVHLPATTDPAERARRLQASWEEARLLMPTTTGPTLSELVVANRVSERY